MGSGIRPNSIPTMHRWHRHHRPPIHRTPCNRTSSKPRSPPIVPAPTGWPWLHLSSAFFFWPLGIIFGHISRSKIRKTGERGAGLALAGLIISYVWGALTVVIVALAVFNAAVNSGYNNLDTLQGSVQQQIDNNLHTPSNADYSPGTDVSSVLCVRVAGTQFSCLVKLSNGQTSTLSITVSSDGSRWLSNN